jgi:hypothetical protein
MKKVTPEFVEVAEILTSNAALGYINGRVDGSIGQEPDDWFMSNFEYILNDPQYSTLHSMLGYHATKDPEFSGRFKRSCYSDFIERVRFIKMATEVGGLRSIVVHVLESEALHIARVKPMVRARRTLEDEANEFGRFHSSMAPRLASLSRTIRNDWVHFIMSCSPRQLRCYAKSHMNAYLKRQYKGLRTDLYLEEISIAD